MMDGGDDDDDDDDDDAFGVTREMILESQARWFWSHKRDVFWVTSETLPFSV